MEFAVTIYQHVMDDLDRYLGFDASSQLISDLYKDLCVLGPAQRQNRDAVEPEVFHHVRIVRAYGLRQRLDFAVNDGWEADRLHVLGVEREVGGRGL